MRILAVSHPSVTDVNQQFYAELEKLGHEVQLIVPANFRTAYSRSSVLVTRWPDFKGDIEQRKVGFSSSIPLHFYQSRLSPLMEKFHPEVLFVEEEPYSVSAWQAFYASRKWPMKRVIYSAQNIVKHYPPPFRWMERYVLANADLAAVVSDEVSQVLREKSFQGDILPFSLGVDTNQFRPFPREREEKRRELGVQDHFVIGYVGRFVEEKGIRTIIEALPYLEYMNVSFVFVGNGPLLEEIRKAKMSLPNQNQVIIADQVQHRDVHLWMNALDTLILPSITMPHWKEQFGRVIIEAMACGVPVLGSDSGEIPVLVTRTGGGWIFPEGNAAALAAAIDSIRTNIHERLEKSKTGLGYVHAHFSKQALASLFAEKLEGIESNPWMKRVAK